VCDKLGCSPPLCQIALCITPFHMMTDSAYEHRSLLLWLFASNMQNDLCRILQHQGAQKRAEHLMIFFFLNDAPLHRGHFPKLDIWTIIISRDKTCYLDPASQGVFV